MTEPTKFVFIDHVEWRLDGKLHREDGPALEYANGSKVWCRYGKHHRENGPAVEYNNGCRRWFLFDEEFTEEEFRKRVYHD